MVDVLDRPPARRLLIALVALTVIVGVAAAINHRDGGIPGDGRLRTDGIATLSRNGLPAKPVNGTVALVRGDVVEAVKGTLTIDLPGGAQLEGRAGTGDGAGTKLLVAEAGQPAELMVGELLVSAARGAEVTSAGNRLRLEPGVDGSSAARLSRSLAVSAGVYRGSATLDSAGQQENIQALREAEVAAVGRAPTEPMPLKLHADDPWDRRFLGAAIDLGLRLQELSDQYTKNEPTLRRSDVRTVGFYRTLLPALATEPAFEPSLLDRVGERDAGELLVGSAITALGRKASFAERWDQVFRLRDDGGAWGLIALDQGVSEDPLLADLNNAVSGTGFDFAQPAGARSTATTAPATAPITNPSGPTGTTRPPSTASPSPTTQPPPTTNPPVVPPITPPIVPPVVPPTGVEPADDLTNTVNQVVGGLLGPPPPP